MLPLCHHIQGVSVKTNKPLHPFSMLMQKSILILEYYACTFSEYE